MWRADEAWRQSLAAVTLADLQEMLAEDLAPDMLKRSFDWLLERAG